jgi:hypothetical protein
VVGFQTAARHEARAVEGAFFPAAHPHADKVDPSRLQGRGAPVGVAVERIAPIDEDVARLQQRFELVDESIHRWACLDHDQDSAGPIHLLHQLRQAVGGGNLFALGSPLDELLGFGAGAVVDNNWKAVAFDVEGQVFPITARPITAKLGLLMAEVRSMPHPI